MRSVKGLAADYLSCSQRPVPNLTSDFSNVCGCSKNSPVTLYELSQGLLLLTGQVIAKQGELFPSGKPLQGESLLVRKITES